MDKLVLGPLLIPHQWLFFLIAGITTYIIVKIILKEHKTFFKTFTDELANALFIWFLIYKFSVVLFHPNILFERPIEILYFTGGSKGMLLGFFVGFSFIVRKAYKHKWNIRLTTQTTVYIVITFFTSYWIIHTLFALF